MQTAEKFWDGMAQRYAARKIPDMANYDATLERVAAYLSPSAKVLELGAGPGTTPIRLAPLVAEYDATDISGELVAIGQARAEEAGVPNLRLWRAGMEDDYGQAAYDAVMGFNLLHLATDPGGLLRHMAETVKPGGYVITKSGCLKDGQSWLRPILWAMQRIGKAPHVHIMSAVELDAMHEAAGLKIVETGWYSRKSGARFVVAQRAGW
ncbi:class I SAM-dependent methyltransferase [Pseudooceanicola sp. LIPI14-2-Ac024]|uniref:class I SAM-dependent methyltransferase n=1 Tax=Pseudooceanicola sp. LIPI14-2-Ac024 TaxID=3344875 RepID=UPI0035CFA630